MPQFHRRNFLVRCCQAVAALLLPEQRSVAALSPDAGLEAFPAERLLPPITKVLDDWSAALLQSPADLDPVRQAISPGFTGSSWQPTRSSVLHQPGILYVQRLSFSGAIPKDSFLAEAEASLAMFSKIVSAVFQVTAIDINSTVRVLYEVTGTGHGFYREQRTGSWLMQWQTGLITNWQLQGETRSRSSAQAFTEITQQAFGGHPQFMLGADEWRGSLDGACGIDIYGHNGVSVGDIDGDGFDDVYICQPAGLPNRLYRNRGDGTFEDITAASGVGLLDNTACALFADTTNNGRQDLIVVRAAGPLLFRNQGNGSFRLQPNAFQFATPPQGTFTGASMADYNRDGYLDIYFCLYSFYQGAGQYKYPVPYFDAQNGPPNFMLHNNGDGTFRDVTAACGLDKNNTRFSFCCAWNGLDLYVVNDFGRKNLYRNNGNGTFTDIAPEAGVEDPGAGMSVSWFDRSLYAANMWTAAGQRITADAHFQEHGPQALYRKHAMGNSLFEASADGFRNVTAETGTANGRWSWSSDAWDFNHDGHSDLYIANGMVSGLLRPDLNSFFWRQVVAQSPNTAQASPGYEEAWNAINEMIREGYSWSGFERNVLFMNHGSGTFSDAAGALGLDFPEDGRSFVLADFNGDGRQELLLKNRNAPQLRLLQNTIPDLPGAISFRLTGTRSNRDAVGAAVTLGSQTKSVQAGSGFLSQHSKELFFGLGKRQGNVDATIQWPSGLTQQLQDLPPGHRIVVVEGRPAIAQPFKPTAHLQPRPSSPVPKQAGTWLLAPLKAPGITPGKAQVLTLTASSDPERLAIYNLLYRYVFDYHRDLPLPASFLIDAQGRVVKIGHIEPDDLNRIPESEAERLHKALPYPGVADTFNYGRNYLSLGSVFFQHGYPEPAKGFFESALKEDPDSAEALYGLGSVYLKQGDNSSAKASFERTVQAKASYPETMPNAWNNLGLLAAKAGDTDRAIQHFEQVLRLDPNHFIALQNLGSAYRQQKRWQPARETLQQALAIKPNDSEANYSLGMVFAQTDDPRQAEACFKKALQARPAYPEALNNLGILYLRTHRRNEAVAVFQESIRVAPAFDQAYLNLARVYSIEGDEAKARAVLDAMHQAAKP